MNQPLPNSLQRELANRKPVDPHPDADLLTAFAEGALTTRERESVFSHLAICAYCREVVGTGAAAAATPAVTATAPLLRPVSNPLRRWLPWAASAAAIVAISSAVILYETNKIPTGSASQKSEAVQPGPSQPPPDVNGNFAKLELPPPAQAERQQASQSAPKQAATTNSQDKLTAPAAPPVNANSLASSAGHAADVASERAAAEGQARGGALLSQRTQNLPAADRGFIQSLPAGSQTNHPLLGETVAPAPSAKAAPAPGYAGAQATAAATDSFAAPPPTMKARATAVSVRPQWRIDDGGHLQRSFGQADWQTVLPGESSRFRVVSVIGSYVWAGGENLCLYHSADNGETWTSVALSPKNGGSTTITRIHFDSAESGRIEMDGGAVWITADAGRTWK